MGNYKAWAKTLALVFEVLNMPLKPETWCRTREPSPPLEGTLYLSYNTHPITGHWGCVVQPSGLTAKAPYPWSYIAVQVATRLHRVWLRGP